MSNHYFFLNSSSLARKLLHHPFFPLTSSMSPSQSPSIISPKQPFSTNQNPFFPSNPTPPPPPYHSLSSLPTFPANISSLVTHPSHSPTPKLLKAITFPIVALSVLSLLLLLLLIFFRRKTRRNVAGEDDDSDLLFPPNSAASDGRKKGANSEFLYLGTLVSSRGEEGGCSAAPPPESSPELRPLPPLERRVRRSSEEEDFYSPSGSPEKFGAELKRVETKRLDFYVSSLSVASSSSSSLSVVSSSSPSSSPRFKLKLPNLAVFRPPPPPLSPPKIELSSCSLKKVPDLLSMENVGEFGRNHFVVVPPPPPPLLAQQGSGFDAVERREELVKPKLKPLHWDKVKASSDRAMVWDQMKSSSFQ